MITIRNAAMEDAGTLLEIYGHYVRSTAISFEYEVPSEVEFRRRMENTMQRYPYLVAEQDGQIQGYAYAGAFNARAAYDWCCETTIYLRRDARKHGMGRMLYDALEEALGKMGMLNLYALVAVPEEDDEYLSTNSRDFHLHLGFREAGCTAAAAINSGGGTTCPAWRRSLESMRPGSGRWCRTRC